VFSCPEATVIFTPIVGGKEINFQRLDEKRKTFRAYRFTNSRIHCHMRAYTLMVLLEMFKVARHIKIVHHAILRTQ